MHRILIIILVLIGLVTFNSQAQVYLGVSGAYNTAINNTGVNLNGQFPLSNHLSITPSFSYYFPQVSRNPNGGWRNLQWFEANLNLNGHLVNSSILNLYLFAGIGGIVSDNKFPDPLIRMDPPKLKFDPSYNMGIGMNFLPGQLLMPFTSIRYNPLIENDFTLLIGLRVRLFKSQKD